MSHLLRIEYLMPMNELELTPFESTKRLADLKLDSKSVPGVGCMPLIINYVYPMWVDRVPLVGRQLKLCTFFLALVHICT